MRTGLILATLLAPFLVSGQGQSRLENKVRKQLDRGKAYPAIRNATALIGKQDNAEFRVLRAEGYNMIGEHAKAEADARASLKQRPEGNTPALMQLATAEQGQGQWDSAAAHLQTILDHSPDLEARFQLATVEQRQGKLDSAMANINQALAPFAPDDATATKLHRLKGEIAAMLGDTALAKAELDRAVSLAPSDPVNYNSRAYYLHAWRGDHRAAIADYDRAIKLNPNYSYAFNNRGWSRYKLGETAKGVRDIGRAKQKKKSNPYVYRNLGMIALETGDSTKACAFFRQALDWGFTAQFGPEVEEKMAASCSLPTGSKAQPPVQHPPQDHPDRRNGTPLPRTNAPQ
ncbi:MAG TPA: tetratricopeptide repeat protein [Flavobacteriales bacterium]|nr:tetratricopeptide repeat protein [Flavobacteriales bacterium]HRO38301.1 tetratricopeptide repeat protein [Flavobacteriales bacterium]HRP80452.1 tetratricopeptide repeat protein [Flavobacteriales bacterium]HRQ84338.1 tetratricopeptide repeat protein [Flavobacteriales bacterium]